MPFASLLSCWGCCGTHNSTSSESKSASVTNTTTPSVSAKSSAKNKMSITDIKNAKVLETEYKKILDKTLDIDIWLSRALLLRCLRNQGNQFKEFDDKFQQHLTYVKNRQIDSIQRLKLSDEDYIEHGKIALGRGEESETLAFHLFKQCKDQQKVYNVFRNIASSHLFLINYSVKILNKYSEIPPSPPSFSY